MRLVQVIELAAHMRPAGRLLNTAVRVKALEAGDVDDILHAFGRDRNLPVSLQAAMPKSLPSLARVEWEYLNRVLIEVEGNVSEAARRLGLHRRSLQRKLAKLPPRQ